jgi:hypothetical protein
LAIHTGELNVARSALDEYLADDSAKNPHGVANAHSNLGLIALYEGDRDTASTHFSEQLALVAGSSPKVTIAEGLYGSAAVAAIDDDEARALRLWGAAENLKSAMRVPPSQPELTIIDRYLNPLQTKVPDSLAKQLRTEGASMPIDEAIALALQTY